MPDVSAGISHFLIGMQEFNDKTAPYQLAFEAYGMQLRLCASDEELLEEIDAMMPPVWQRRPRSPAQHTLGLIAEGSGIYSVYYDGICIHDAPGRDYALTMMEAQIQGHVALDAQDFVFLHAGVVADGEQAIVMPGRSFAGKTTLVRTLVEAGLLYYSDEFAVLDEAGRVHPYPRRLSLRASDGDRLSETYVEALGGRTGQEPLPIGLAIVTHYRPGAEWRPQRLSKGAGALALFEHAVPAQARPEQTMAYLRAAIDGAVVLDGERGEADEFARVLLDRIRAAA
jgi:hypothetical protein